LFIQGLKENFQGKILRIGVNLLRNKIDYDTLKKFLNALSTEELYKKFALEGLNLLSNEIGEFLNNTESFEILEKFLKTQKRLKDLKLKCNFNYVTAETLCKLF